MLYQPITATPQMERMKEELQRITKMAEEATQYDMPTNEQLWEESQNGIIRLIKLSADSGMSWCNPEELLGLACERDAEAVDIILKGVVDKNKAMMEKEMTLASRRGSMEVVKVLIKHGVNVDKASNGYWPLFSACDSGHFKMVKLLLDCGAKVHL